MSIERTLKILQLHIEQLDRTEIDKFESLVQQLIYEYNGSDITQPICSYCLQNCEEKQLEVGEGASEFWGIRDFDSKTATVSDCCEDEIL